MDTRVSVCILLSESVAVNLLLIMIVIESNRIDFKFKNELRP